MGEAVIAFALVFVGCCIRDAGVRIHDPLIKRSQAQQGGRDAEVQ